MNTDKHRWEGSRIAIAFICVHLCSSVVFISAVSAEAPERAADLTVVVDPRAVSAGMGRTGGSLYQAAVLAQPENRGPRYGTASFFSVPPTQPRTIKKHDIVIVIISEQSDASAKGTSDLKKQYDMQALLSQWISLKPKNWAIQGGAQGPNPPSIAFNADRNFKGEATVDRTDSMSARIAAEVLDVKPNGTIVLSATKHVKNDDEDQQFRLTGNCRAEDVTADNTVLSTQLMDLDLAKTTKGAVRDTTNRGFVAKVLDQINPF